MKVKVVVGVRVLKGVLDAQGQAICKALHHNGLTQVESVSQGKLIDIILQVEDMSEAERLVQEACSSVLVNRHTEGYTFQMEEMD